MDLSDVLEPHNIAGLLKLHYREMKINLIPRGEMSREITRAAKARDVSAARLVLLWSVPVGVPLYRWMQSKTSCHSYPLRTLP